MLVNNAGITQDGLILRMEDEDFDVVIDTNLKSAFVAIRAAARPMMRAKGGRIINISSASRAWWATPGRPTTPPARPG